MWAKLTPQIGFTIVELLVVVVVIAILASVTIVSYGNVHARALTTSSFATLDQVRKKAATWNTFYDSYPDLAQLRTNSLSPPNIDTPGGEAGPIEAKLSSPDIAMGATINPVRADNGRTVYYAPCWNGTKFSGAIIAYWDYSKSAEVLTTAGTCP